MPVTSTPPIPPPVDPVQLRRDLGLTPAQFARLVGVTLSTVSRWESRDAMPSGAHADIVYALRQANDGPSGLRIRSLIVCLVHEKRGRLLDLLLELFDSYGG